MRSSKILTSLLCFALALSVGFTRFVPQVQADDRAGKVLGVHILNTSELDQADQLLSTKQAQSEWRYVTIPLSLAETSKADEWQRFFNQAKEKKIIPIVRLTTAFENGAWKIPTRKDIITEIAFLEKLQWPTDQKHIIVFNEVNHATEWGGTLDPAGYAQVLRFTADWAHSSQAGFVVMPAAMDLAAPNGSATREAFTYLNQMLAEDAEILNTIDVWNSHSYPNPGFSSSPERTAQNSLRGFLHELAFLKQKTGKDFQVVITETGWEANRQTARWLETYYLYAFQHIWNHPQVLAVTPFVLRGDPGPFSQFSFFDRNNQPTVQYTAFRNALTRVLGG